MNCHEIYLVGLLIHKSDGGVLTPNVSRKNFMSRINLHQKEYKDKIELTKTPLGKRPDWLKIKFPVGDNFNDVGMFELAGISVAMANAQEGVKELAKIVLPHTNDEDGVAKYLKDLKNA